MKRLLAFAVVAILAACAEEPPVFVPLESFRDQGAQIASQTNVTADRMAGDWVVRQGFASQRQYGDRFTLSVLPDGALQLSFPRSVCLHGECVIVQGPLILLQKTGPGRWTPVDPPARWTGGELWVMWMDFDNRTAAIGTPSGEFGWIMDKNPTGGRDRITAARDIMDWFGYDVGRLQGGDS